MPRKNKDLLAETDSHEPAQAALDGGGASGLYGTLQRDLAVLRQAVDAFIAAVFKQLELCAHRLPSARAVWNVEMQRLMPAETLNLYLLNELLDPFLGETSDFRNLLNSGGAAACDRKTGAVACPRIALGAGLAGIRVV